MQSVKTLFREPVKNTVKEAEEHLFIYPLKSINK